MKKLILILTLFLSLSVVAQINPDDYDLTPAQRDLVQRLIDRGLEEHLILKLIENMQRGHQPPPQVYIPPHTQDELLAVQRWAEGGAFKSFAQYAGVEFNFQKYMSDCPNMAIFNFGRATGTAHIRTDVLQRFNGRVYQLELLRARLNPEDFRKSYLELIKSTPHYKYVNEDL